MTSIEYRLHPRFPRGHRLLLQCQIGHAPADGAVFRLAAWTPGSYKIRDHARNVLSATATASGEPVAVRKLDKQSWHCAPVAGELTFTLELYAHENSVRGLWLDEERALLDGAGLYPRVDGLEDLPCRVEIRPPAFDSDWSVATALQAEVVDERGFGWYQAANHRELIDQPIGMGSFETLAFEAGGVPHRLALFGAPPCDRQRLGRDVQQICAQHIAQMGAAPQSQYLFLLQLGAQADGGLEHAQASTLIAGRDWLPLAGEGEATPAYRRLLGLVSHEYFHLWNVKRIRPQALTASDLQREAYSEDLWAYEGVTSYLDDWTLRRGGLLTPAQYLETLGESLTRLARTPGRLRRSLAEASFDAWIGLYQPGENTHNATVSYYLKGSLVALALDLELRLASAGELSLLDLMRDLFARWRQDGAAMPERALEDAALARGGDALATFFARYVRGTDEPDWMALLAAFGVRAERRPASGLDDPGGKPAEQAVSCELGLRVEPGAPSVRAVDAGSPAEAAGLQPGDELLAWDGLRLDRARLDALTRQHRPGQPAQLHLFRQGRLLQTEIVPGPPPAECWVLTQDAQAGPQAVALRQGWIGA